MRIVISFILILMVVFPVATQQESVTVPDLTGLNPALAAAELNRVGLALGAEMNVEWTEVYGTPPNVIALQSVTAGSTVDYGTTVDVTILRNANVMLTYDNNDFTMHNQDSGNMELDDVKFRTFTSTIDAGFNARRWMNILEAGKCAQLWSVSRGEPKDVAGCQSIQRWQTTNNPADHFWTAANGVESFVVLYEDAEMAICDAAPRGSQDNPSTCQLFLPAIGGNNVAPYVQFSYTPETFLVVNSTDDSWMRTNRSVIHNANPRSGRLGTSFTVGDRNLFTDMLDIANVRKLAPGQCIQYGIEGAMETDLPEDCDLIGTVELPEQQRFWLYDFDLESSDGKRRTCNAAQIGVLTRCLLPL